MKKSRKICLKNMSKWHYFPSKINEGIFVVIIMSLCLKYFVFWFSNFGGWMLNHRSRKKDKLRYRYPRGESYLDVIQRCVI